MSKKLTLKEAKSALQKYNQKKKIELNDNWYIHIFPHFKPQKVKEMMTVIFQDLNDSDTAKIDMSDASFMDWVFFNIICFFTDLEIPKSIKEKKEAFNILKELNILDTIVCQYPEESVLSLEKELSSLTLNIDNWLNMNEKNRNEWLKLTTDNQLLSVAEVLQSRTSSKDV